MPTRQAVEAFVALVEAGDYVGAIEQFYAPDAATRENTAEPVSGRNILMAKERGVMASFRKIEASRVGPSLIDGDTAGRVKLSVRVTPRPPDPEAQIFLMAFFRGSLKKTSRWSISPSTATTS